MGILRYILHKAVLWFFKPNMAVVSKICPLPICWTPDIKKGESYQHGIFEWGGHTVETNTSPFLYTQNPHKTPETWGLYAHSFQWILHIQSTSGCAKCSQWILDWCRTYDTDFSNIAWQLDVASNRLCTWLSHYDALVMDMSYEDRTIFHNSIAIHYSYLEYACNNGFVTLFPPTKIQQLYMWRAIICAGLSLNDNALDIPPLMDKFLKTLDTMMDEDGFIHAHLPTHIEVLKICLYVRSSLHKMGAGTPEVLDGYVDKMWRVVRFFYNVVGDFAHMAGASALNHEYHMIKRLCKNERHIVPSLQNSGYYIQKTSGFNVYLDGMPRVGLTTDNGGVLAMTLYHQKHPICVACGYTPHMGNMCQYTATHNTLSINDTNIVPVHTLQNRAFRKKYTACLSTMKQYSTGDWHIWETAHMAYEQHFGVKIERKVGTHENGTLIRGQDSVIFLNNFSLAQPMDITIRFHLHPNIRPMILESGQVVLTSNKTSSVIFKAKNCTVFIESSYYIDEKFVYKPTEQLVLKQKFTPEVLGEKHIHIKWSFHVDKQ